MPGINNLKPVLKNQRPIGSKIMVQHKIKPMPHAQNANGTSINNQKQADNNAPVILNPNHNIKVKNPKPTKNPNISIPIHSLFVSHLLSMRLPVPTAFHTLRRFSFFPVICKSVFSSEHSSCTSIFPAFKSHHYTSLRSIFILLRKLCIFSY